MPDGSQIVDHAAAVFMPNLLFLPSGSESEARHRPGATIVTNLGPTRFTRELTDRQATVPRLTTIPTRSRAELTKALKSAPCPDVVVIANHGHTAATPADRSILLADGGTLSVAEARDIAWPPIVVLVACWSSDITVEAGADPLGLPTACLLGKATAVVGGQSEINNIPQSAALLADVVLHCARAQHPALALRAATVAHLTKQPLARRSQPAQWANLTVWSSTPPLGPQASRPPWQLSALSRTAWDEADRTKFVVPAQLSKLISDRDPAPKRVPSKRNAPRPSPELIDTFTVSAAENPRGVLTTMGFVTALTTTGATSWQALAKSGFSLARPNHGATREDNHGGDQLTVNTHQVTATDQLIAAYRTASALAYHLQLPEVTPAHMLYGVLVDISSEAARHVFHTGDGDTDPLRALEGHVFHQSLPPPASLSPAPEPYTRSDAVAYTFLPLFALAVLGRWAFAKGGRFVAGLTIVAILGIVSILHSAGSAGSTVRQLADVAPVITATIRTSAGRHAQPATLLGKLGTFYVEPAISGFINGITQAVQSGPPATIQNRYAFVTPAPPDPHASTVVLSYRGASYGAQLRCPSHLAPLCIAVARLPASTAATSFTWGLQSINGTGPGDGVLTFKADVYPADGTLGTVDIARLTAAPTSDTGKHELQLSALLQSGQPIRPAGPVVLNGTSEKPPLLGIAIPARSGSWTAVYPAHLLAAFLVGIADDLAGSRPGATAFAGFAVASHTANADAPGAAYVSSVCIGTPAEDAGLEVGDQIIAVAGTPVATPTATVSTIHAHHPGDSIPLVVARAGAPHTLVLTLGYRPLGSGC